MMRALVAASLLAGCVYPVIADAADMSVFGFTLGEPVSLSKCPLPNYGENTCVWIREAFPPNEERIFITFALMEKPGISAESTIIGTLVNGNLEAVSFDTGGIDAAERVLVDLTKKYGKPSELRRPIMQNRMGARFRSVNAVWRLAQLQVIFYGAMNDIDSGKVYIQTPKGAAAFIHQTKTRDPKPL